MKVPVLFVPVCLSCFILSFGCSGDDQPSVPPPSPKVVRTIKQVPPEQGTAPPAEHEQKSLQTQGAKATEPAKKSEETNKNEAIEKPMGGVGVSKSLVVETLPAPAKAESKEPGGQESKAQETKAQEAKAEEQKGYYSVKKGDSLIKIASRKSTMQDPLKWPILLRLNLDKLGDLPVSEDLATWELSPGIKLRFITPGQAKEGLKTPSKSVWVVNVMSTPNEAEIVPKAATLVKKGYPAYITRAYVNGKDYLRLRVGFFANKKEASARAEKIRDLLKLKDSWVTKADNVEYEEVAGFLKTP
jgi:SPOR domain